ncbi:hypothetical protein BRADO3210 [Bradyrhizobium sp. ORS 278]|nr:hypothetical protein BRADO3210 [Bradyrhizobium sp. ORS 278]
MAMPPPPLSDHNDAPGLKILRAAGNCPLVHKSATFNFGEGESPWSLLEHTANERKRLLKVWCDELAHCERREIEFVATIATSGTPSWNC